MPLLALGELGGDEFRGGALHDFLFEPCGEFAIERLVTEQIAGFQQGGADGHVRPGLADALVDGPRGVADLLPHVPEAIEQSLGDRFSPRRLFVGQQKQQIDVGARRQQAAAIAAGRDHRHAFGLRARPAADSSALDGEVEQDPDDFVLRPAKPLRAAAPVPILFSRASARARACGQRRFEPAGDGGAQFALAAGVAFGEGLEVGDNRGAVDQVGGARGPR